MAQDIHYRLRRSVCTLLVMVSLTPLQLMAGKVESYAITQESTPPGGRPTAITKWFVVPRKSRVVLTPDATDPARVLVVITRRDKGLTWTLHPRTMAYIEQPLDEDGLRAFGERLGDLLDVEHLGRERIRGFDCDKRRVTGEVESGTRKGGNVQTLWQCDGFDIPLRIEGEDGARTRTKELQVGPQPAHLFEIPSGYAKAKDLGDLLRMRRAP